ncbi:hypothetical protein ALC53_04781 [Atta colombica]|uniref:Uncharacterized protein n=1 Tax=Atta colombica TaxID=520822 RepID=A0A195BK12_9HYME|nr:hypothetical protein ALC53_04781 [Atta colombica]
MLAPVVIVTMYKQNRSRTTYLSPIRVETIDLIAEYSTVDRLESSPIIEYIRANYQSLVQSRIRMSPKKFSAMFDEADEVIR